MIEIDGVKRRLEACETEAGDHIVNTYVWAIDLSTSPQPLSLEDTQRLASYLRRLNRNLATTSLYLHSTEAADAYDSVVGQLNHINQGQGFDELFPLMDGQDGFAGNSSRFKFGDGSMPKNKSIPHVLSEN